MSLRPAWSTVKNSKTGSNATEKPVLKYKKKKPQNKKTNKEKQTKRPITEKVAEA